MFIDICILVGITICQAATGYWAFHMSVDNGRARWGFAAITLIGIGFVIWSGIRGEQSSDSIANGISSIQGQLTRIATAANVNPNQSASALANEIIKKLSNPTWYLTDDEKHKLGAEIDDVPQNQRFPLVVAGIPSSTASLTLMADIVTLFTEHHWDASSTQDFDINPGFVGFAIAISSTIKTQSQVPSGVGILTNIFQKSGLGTPQIGYLPGLSGNQVELIIGLKPD